MTSSHDNKKFRTRSMEKLRGMAFGFRKTATAVKKPDRFIYLFIYPSAGLKNGCLTRGFNVNCGM